MKTPEGYEKDDIDKYLEQFGDQIYVIKPATFGMGQSGHADRICCWRGNFFAIEAKREGKEPTALQAIRMDEVRAAGGVAFWGTAAKVIPELQAWMQHGTKPEPYTLYPKTAKKASSLRSADRSMVLGVAYKSKN